VWLAAAFRSPSYQVAGLMPAGLPIVGIGRNADIAWAGTSLHAASSDLVDASDLPLTERETTVRVRGGRDRVLRLRESEFGPIVSDGMILRHDRPLALAWMGHRASDEMGAMLGVMRADGAEAFRAALTAFALPGQNMIHAGRDGRVSHLLAVRVPRRPNRAPHDLIATPEEARAAWADLAGTEAMPHWEGAEDGVVATANDAPPDGMQAPPAPVGFFFSPPERVRRLREVLGGEERIGPDRLAAAQTDVYPPGVLGLRDLLLDRAGPVSGPAVAALRTWGGGYEAESRGAVAFEVTMAELLATLGRRGPLAAAKAVWTTRQMLAEEIAAMPDARLRPALLRALRAADRQVQRAGGWGAFHRMRLRHHLGAAPLLGRRFTYGGWPSPGGNDTLHKTAHAPARRPHAVSYGASARFVTDLAEPDANRVVLLGGQDGWLGSTTFLDQAPLWRSGQSLPLPLRAETARDWPFHTVITPAG
jgi:penicillin G amidase